MFQAANAFNQPITDWDTSGVKNMRNMFFFAFAFNQSLTDWDTLSATDMESMFQKAKAFNQNLCNWGVYYNSSDVTYSNMFLYSDCINTTDPGSADGPWCANC